MALAPLSAARPGPGFEALASMANEGAAPLSP